MTIGILLGFAVICLVVDLGIRTLLARLREQRRRREREEALATSLNLDFTHEAKSLKRVEVENPVARILCVDDEPIVLDSFRKILVLDGYAVDTVETGQEALGLIQVRDYDFLFTDLRMPTMDGVDVVKSARHLRPDTDVVIITGYATVETAVECMKHGAMDYVQKPFAEDELRAFVKKALIKRTDRQEKRLRPKVNITASPVEENRAGEFCIPGGVMISKGHCWVSVGQNGMVKVGLDDFARKLIGRVDAVELPAVAAPVRVGERLFSVRQGTRRIHFTSPISGRVADLNRTLTKSARPLEATPYHDHWLCAVQADNLDPEIRELRIGKAAAALFDEDIARAQAFAREAVKPADGGNPVALEIGAIEQLSDQDWTRCAEQFFERAK
jgi:CheY-like chemotaxis protein/glycine cleavage system H lipoate-binding protein